MRKCCVFCLAVWMALSPAHLLQAADVQVIGQMRRMFTEHDIRPNVEVGKINQAPHLYALGPVAGLRGEITVLDGQVFVSTVNAGREDVRLEPKTKSVFLVYSSVSDWQAIGLPSRVVTESDIGKFLESQLPPNSRSAFLVKGTAVSARYHIQNYQGKPSDLTHEAHDKAKVFFEIAETPIELVGFFSNREGDAGSFVHMGHTTHIHLISLDRKHMGHLESLKLLPGARLLLPAQQ